MSKKVYPQRIAKTVHGGLRPQGIKRDAWWRTRWLTWLEGLHLGARLGRGRSYAQLGQIKQLSLLPGSIEATIQGAQDDPYHISITMDPLPDDVVTELLKNDPLLSAQLHAHALPLRFEERLNQLNLSLFPEKRRDLSYHCTCKDWARPCKHIAAALCLFFDATAADPHLLLRFRGLLLPEIPPTLIPKQLSEKDLARLRPATNGAMVTKRLGALPYWRGSEDLKKTLDAAYQRAHQKALIALESFADLRLPEDHPSY
jgi:uncharacterized Zn finger protein